MQDTTPEKSARGFPFLVPAPVKYEELSREALRTILLCMQQHLRVGFSFNYVDCVSLRGLLLSCVRFGGATVAALTLVATMLANSMIKRDPLFQ